MLASEWHLLSDARALSVAKTSLAPTTRRGPDRRGREYKGFCGSASTAAPGVSRMLILLQGLVASPTRRHGVRARKSGGRWAAWRDRPAPAGCAAALKMEEGPRGQGCRSDPAEAVRRRHAVATSLPKLVGT